MEKKSRHGLNVEGKKEKRGPVGQLLTEGKRPGCDYFPREKEGEGKKNGHLRRGKRPRSSVGGGKVVERGKKRKEKKGGLWIQSRLCTEGWGKKGRGLGVRFAGHPLTHCGGEGKKKERERKLTLLQKGNGEW